jgi:acetyl-CoA/propionyl-CoA carboxylase biotin carboxyl carrier protein
MACNRLALALDELIIEGVPTTASFHRLAVDHPAFRAAKHATSSVEREWDLSSLTPAVPRSEVAAQRYREELVTVEVDDRRFDVRVLSPARSRGTARRPIGSARGGASSTGNTGEVLAPMQGTIIAYAVESGAHVEVGDPIVTLEAMKMENTLRAQIAGTVSMNGVAAGTVVQPGALLATIVPD